MVDGNAQIRQPLGKAEKRGKIAGPHLEIERNAAAREFLRESGGKGLWRGADAAETRVALAVVEVAAPHHDGDHVWSGQGQSGALDDEDGAGESITRENRFQMFRRMVWGKADVGVYAQRRLSMQFRRFGHVFRQPLWLGSIRK